MNLIKSRIEKISCCTNCDSEIESCDKCGEFFDDGETVYCNVNEHLCEVCYDKKRGD